MRDLVYFLHIIAGISIAVFSIYIILNIHKKDSLVKKLAIATSIISWAMLVPAGLLYLNFYPATKTLILKSSWPWAHSIAMETKEHWGLLLPFVATVAALLVLSDKKNESKKWWVLLAALTILIAVLGRIVKMGAVA